ncbi:hypothetical protein ACJX0J_025868, partial [Zea mays]
AHQSSFNIMGTSMNAIWLLLGDGLLILYLLHDNCVSNFISSMTYFFVNAIWTIIGDVHCVDWNPLDFNYILIDSLYVQTE